MSFDLQKCRENFLKRQAARYAAREALRQRAKGAALEAILRIISRYPQVKQVYLFGSVVQPGQFHEESDIDIAVAGTDAAAYFDLWRALEEGCPGWMIDLREINAPSHFSDVVRQTGELIYDTTDRATES